MKNKLFKGLSLSANPKHLIKGVFSAAQCVFAEFSAKNHTLGNNKFRTKQTDVSGLGFGLLRRYTPRNDAERNNIAFKALDVVRQCASKFFKIAESGVDKVGSSCEKNPSVRWRYMNFLRQRKTALDAPLSAVSAGRSMIEMLGVLAIVGVLSVGGIAGYSKAMEKFKVNKTIEEYSFMITDLLSYKDDLIKNNKERPMYLAQIIKDLNFVPQTWQEVTNIYITDTLGNKVAPYINIKNNLIVDINIFSNDKKSSDYSKELCITLIKDLAKGMYSSIDFISPQNTSHSSGGKTAPHFITECQNMEEYDDTYKCLKDLTMPEITESCKECLRNTNICNVVFRFKK